MFVDARSLDDGTKIESDVCVIGAGVAGITLALELDKQGIHTCLLESGGMGPDDETRDLYRGESADLPYHFADGCRSRFLGGSSNCWGGWCRPFDDLDFEKRDWVRNSGWPINRADLEAYYQRTHDILKLGPYNYDSAYWERAIGRADVKRIPLPTGRVVDAISQFSPPVRMGKLYRDALSRSKHIRVVLYANVTEIETGPDACSVRSLRIATLSGRRLVATAREFVLATGGIENARLLLVSNKTQPAGLGNGHDLVGRFFMDHPRIYCGSIKFAREWERNKLFDIKFHYQNHVVAANGTRIAAQFTLTPAVQAQHQISNAKVWFSSVFPGDETEAAETLIRIKHRMEQKEQPGSTLARDLLTLAAHPIDATGFAMARIFQPRWLVRDVQFQAIVEPEPDPDARVTLHTERDRLGMNRVRVGWRLSSIVRRSFDRNFQIMADELERTGVAKVTLDPPLEGRNDWPASLHDQGTWHHMGTTRMHESPRSGVVDRNCRVHGIANLYVAGSSVFPTAGANFPTITICALAIRLAEHLSKVVRASESPIGRAGAAVAAA
jgi:choline dehydrogenase-like flavoprotein